MKKKSFSTEFKKKKKSLMENRCSKMSLKKKIKR